MPRLEVAEKGVQDRVPLGEAAEVVPVVDRPVRGRAAVPGLQPADLGAEEAALQGGEADRPLVRREGRGGAGQGRTGPAGDAEDVEVLVDLADQFGAARDGVRVGAALRDQVEIAVLFAQSA